MRSQVVTCSTTCQNFTRTPVAMAFRSPRQPAILGHFSGFRHTSKLECLSYGCCKSATLQAKVQSQVSARGSSNVKALVPTRMMFDGYTQQAIKVVTVAQEEGRRLGHNFVGTEQILLGLMGQSPGIAAKVLKGMGVSLKDARVGVEEAVVLSVLRSPSHPEPSVSWSFL